MKQLLTLRESETISAKKVDWSKGIIYGVKVLAETSRNGFVYPRDTRQKAHKLLENLRVNIDHLSRRAKGEDVPLNARFGKLINVREGTGGTYADLKFNVKHKLAESIAYAAEELPDTLGMSINGTGYKSGTTPDGKTVVGEIGRLRSCDVVADPGSTITLFESEQMDDELPGTDPGVAASLTGMKAAVTHLVENATDEAALVSALTAWCDKYKSAEGDEEEAEVKESLNDADQLARLKAEKACVTLCESLKVTHDTALVEMLADLPTDDKRKALLVALKKTTGVTKPKSAPAVPLRESAPVKPVDPAQRTQRSVDILRGRN